MIAFIHRDGLINVVLYKLLASMHLGNKPGVMKSDNDIDTDLCSIIRKLLLLHGRAFAALHYD